MADERPLDIVLFGATGLHRRADRRVPGAHAPEGTRWALAGRSPDEAARRARAAGRDRSRRRAACEADVSDAGALRDLAECTRVVATTVGPYLRYGEPLVAACAEAGTDYVDLTGEPEFVDRMYVRHHDTRGRERRPARARVRLRLDPARPRRPTSRAAAARGRAADGRRLRPRGRQASPAAPSPPRSRVLARPPGGRRAPERPKPRAEPRARWPGGPGRGSASRALGGAAADDRPADRGRSAGALERYGPDFRYRHYAAVKRLPVALGGIAGVGRDLSRWRSSRRRATG